MNMELFERYCIHSICRKIRDLILFQMQEGGLPPGPAPSGSWGQWFLSLYQAAIGNEDTSGKRVEHGLGTAICLLRQTLMVEDAMLSSSLALIPFLEMT